MKPEQRATLGESHDLEMPRQGVSFLNDMLDRGRPLHKTHLPTKTSNNINTPMLPVKHENLLLVTPACVAPGREMTAKGRNAKGRRTLITCPFDAWRKRKGS